MCTARSSVMRLLAVVACLAAYTGCSCAAPLALRDGAGKLTEFQAAMTEGSRTRRASDFAADTWGRCTTMKEKNFCNRRFVQKRCCTTCECRKPTTNGKRARRATADENQAVGHSGTLLSAATSPSAGSAPAPALDRNARGNARTSVDYFLADAGQDSCPRGSTGVAKAECIVAALAAGREVGRSGSSTLGLGTWTHTPPGCFVDVPKHPLVPHFSSGTGRHGEGGYPNEEYQLVCAEDAATPTPVSYQGCYSTSGQHIGGYSGRNTLLETCADIASTGSKPYFGMEWPQGSTTPGSASCAHAMTKLPTNRVADSECGAPYNGRRLGGPWRVAVYATRQFFTRRTAYGGKCEVAVTEEQCREHRTATEAAEPPRQIHSSFAGNWPSLPHGCQLIETSPGANGLYTRIVFNRVGSDLYNIAMKERTTCNKHTNHWCYASQSRMVCPADECQAPLDSDAPKAKETAGYSTVDDWNAFKLEPEYLVERDTTDYADYAAARVEWGLSPESHHLMCAMFPQAKQSYCMVLCPDGTPDHISSLPNGDSCTHTPGGE